MPLIDVEQAVEAVRTAIPDVGGIWQDPIDGVHAMRLAAIAALRAIQPQEPSVEEVASVAHAIREVRKKNLPPGTYCSWNEALDEARAAIAAMKRNGGKEG